MDADKREEKEKAEGVSNGEKQPFFFFFGPGCKNLRAANGAPCEVYK
jgi:hypothetical protein